MYMHVLTCTMSSHVHMFATSTHLLHACESLRHACESLRHACTCDMHVCTCAGEAQQEELPEEVGGFPVAFLKQVVSFPREKDCELG